MSHQKPPAMNPEDLPQQRLYEVKPLPDFEALPPPVIEVVGSEGIPMRKPSSATFLCQAEWSWSPIHHRLENYHVSLNTKRDKWLLWVSYYNDWERPWKWETYQEVYSIDRSVVMEKSAASLQLLWKYWSDARDDEYIEEFHWIGAEGSLVVKDLQAIAGSVWRKNQQEA